MSVRNIYIYISRRLFRRLFDDDDIYIIYLSAKIVAICQMQRNLQRAHNNNFNNSTSSSETKIKLPKQKLFRSFCVFSYEMLCPLTKND